MLRLVRVRPRAGMDEDVDQPVMSYMIRERIIRGLDA